LIKRYFCCVFKMKDSMKRQVFLHFIFWAALLSKANFQTVEFDDDIDSPIIEMMTDEYVSQTKIEKDLIDFAKKHIGTRYKVAGKTPEGFDCSGFVGFVFKHFGVTLPGSSREMAKIGDSIQIHDLKVGDLVFFEGRTRNKVVGHVGIVCEIDENDIYFIHASTHSVIISRMREPYYSPRFLLAKRIVW